MQFNRLPNRGFRVRKQGGIVSTIMGVFVGLGFIVLGSPLAVWFAESQHQADDFSTAQQVTADEVVDGYVAVTGEATVLDTLACPAAATETVSNCVLVTTTLEEYTRTEKEQCGSVPTNAEIVRELAPECDSDGTNCSSCYIIAQYDWQQLTDNTDYAAFTLGSYTITPNDDANVIGEGTVTTYALPELEAKPEVGNQRTNYEYLSLDQITLVAGTASTGEISGAADDKPFVISNLDYTGTLAELAQQDATMKWGLRILSLALMVFGMILLAGPLTLFTNVFKVIPFLGKRLDQGFDAVIGFVAGLIGVVAWLVLWGIVLVLKNIWIILLVLLVVAVIVVVLVQRGKKRQVTAAPTPTPDQPVQS